MEKEYIFFKKAQAFWFSVLCVILLLSGITALVLYAKLTFWQLSLLVIVFNAVAIMVAFSIDADKE